VYLLDLASGGVSTVLRLERPLVADAPRWSPDGRRLAVQVEQMDDEGFDTGAAIAIVDVAGGEPRYITDLEAFASAPDWSWVRDELVYSVELAVLQRTLVPGQETSNLFAILPDGSGGKQITNVRTGERLLAPRWTPDGTGIIAKQFDHESGGGRRVDPATGEVEAFVTDLEVTRPLVRPGVD
jgi:Tol biopolymer transport system component